jgi:hypothetical protein
MTSHVRSLVLVVVAGCAASPSPATNPPAPAPRECGNAVLHEQFDKDLAEAQAEPEPARRAEAVCKVARNWGIEDCSNVTPASLNLP